MRRIAPPPAPLTRAANAQTGLTEVPTPSSHPSRSPPPAPIPAADDLQGSERCPRASQGGRAAAPALTSGKRPKPGNPAGTATPLPPCPYRGERLGAASPKHFCTNRPRYRAGTGPQDNADPRGTPRLLRALVQTEAAGVRQRGAMTFGGCAGSCPTTESRGLRPSAFPPGAGRFARRSCHGAGLAFSPRPLPPPGSPPASGVAEAHSSIRGRPLPRVPAGCGAGCGSGGSLSFAAGAMAAGKPQSLAGPGGPSEPWRLPAEGRSAPGRYLR